MRVTNNMIANNMLLNLNRNLSAMEKLQQQWSTGKKIQYPSDDPIIAGKALKLRTTVAETEQYQKNIKDGLSWMDVTEQAFMNIDEILDRMRELCVEASSDTLETEDQEKVTSELEQLKMQLVQEGNVNYAGRYVFSGYKTDKKLVFDQDNTEEATITEHFTKKDIETVQIGEKEVQRIRLAYDDLESNISTHLNIVDTDALASSDDPHIPPAGTVYYNKSTGELFFNEADVSSVEDFYITYEKKGFEAGDLNPEHYFGTMQHELLSTSSSAAGIQLAEVPIVNGSLDGNSFLDAAGNPSFTTNPDILYMKAEDAHTLQPNEIRVNVDTGEVLFGTGLYGQDITTVQYQVEQKQNIQYEVGINNKININTLGKDILTPDLIRDIDELISNVRNAGGDQLEEDMLNKKFSAMLGKLDNHMKQLSREHANLGSRMNRLELTKNRLGADEINFTELMSENEDIDLAEVMTKFRSQEMVYQASLMTSARVIQQTLVDFIR